MLKEMISMTSISLNFLYESILRFDENKLNYMYCILY